MVEGLVDVPDCVPRGATLYHLYGIMIVHDPQNPTLHSDLGLLKNLLWRPTML